MGLGRTISLCLALVGALPLNAQILSGIMQSQGAAGSQVATPTFSPAAGVVASGTTVTIATSTPLAVLCYTTDGSTPTESANLCSGGTTQTYTTPVSVTSAITIKALGTLAAYTDSAVGSAAYTLASGSVTQANLRLSTLNGVAFVDFNSSGLLCPYVGDKITITDGSSHTAVGWIKACGTGETYGSQLLPNTAFANTTSVTSGDSAVLSSVSCSSVSTTCLKVAGNGSANFPYGCSTATTNVGQVIRNAVSGGGGTETSLLYFVTRTGSCGGTTLLSESPAISGSYAAYNPEYVTAVATTTAVLWESYTATQYWIWGDPSLKQVTAPSTTGVIIVSASGGSTQNWASVSGSFVYNAGVTYAITTN